MKCTMYWVEWRRLSVASPVGRRYTLLRAESFLFIPQGLLSMLSRKRGIPHKQSYASGDGEMNRKERELEGEIDIDQRSAAAASVVRFVRACLSLLPVVQVRRSVNVLRLGDAFILVGVKRAVSPRCTDDGWMFMRKRLLILYSS